MKRILIIFAAVALSLAAAVDSFAQSGYEVKGTIVDNLGPIIGATVMEQGTANGVATDFDGVFTIMASSKDAVLEVACMGYASVAFKASEFPGTLLLKEDQNFLDEVVVIGYGTMEKKNVTSSITSISSSDLLPGQGGSTLATALKGKISGLSVNESASPNAAADFQLRGVASINASSEPLVVVDGMPGADLRALNFDDVLSIDVLKDASAGAIYGTRAAAGVILITTKKPNEGKMNLSYTAELSTEQRTYTPNIMTADEYVLMGAGTDYGYTTDWYSALLQEGKVSHKHVLSFSGGSKAASIQGSVSYSDQKGLAVGDNRQDISGRINGKFTFLDDALELHTHVSYRQADRDQRYSSGNFTTAMRLNPTLPIYDENNPSGYNVLTGDSYAFNPVADLMLKQRDKLDKWLNADMTLKLNLPYGLSASVTAGWQDRQAETTYYTDSNHKSCVEGGYTGSAYHAFSKTVDVSLEPTINFAKSFGDHNVDAVAGYSFFEKNSQNFSAENFNFPNDALGAWDLGAGDYLKEGKAGMKSEKFARVRLISFFGRANYNYKSRYVVSASVRHEGSSKFGADHRWGTFWSLSGGWRISSEPWMESLSGFLDDLKLRVGYGVTGNNGFDSGYTALRYKSEEYWPMNGGWIMAYGPANNVNYDLHWEEKAELNIGLDYAFFNNRLHGKFDVYRRWVSGMIYNINVATPPATHSQTALNYGDLENWGWEFEIGGSPVKTKNFEWSTAMRFSKNESKITSLWGNQTYQDRVSFPTPGTHGSGGRLEEGTQVGSFFLLKYAGVNEEGKWLVYNKDGAVILADNSTYNDKRYLGDAIPALIFSWDHNFSYKNAYLGITLRSWLDFDVLNTSAMYYGVKNTAGWNSLRTAYTENKHITQDTRLTDYWLEDGSFLKIDAVSLGYKFDFKKKYINALDLYFTVRNVACFTNYSGFDPEVNINGLDPGYEWYYGYPDARRYTLGVKLSF